MYLLRVRVLLLSVLILANIPAASPSGTRVESFVLDSTGSTYPFTLRLEGTLERRVDTLLISVRSGEIRSAIPLHLGENGVATEVRIALGLGTSIETGWRMGYYTEDQVVAPRLAPGQSVTLDQLTFTVAGIEDAPLADLWLAARLGVMQHLPGVPEGLLWSYACSEQNILGVTEASRERAKQMKAAYSHTC
jgi:hypothetical protein